MRDKTAPRSERGEENEIRGVETQEVEIKVNEQKVSLVGKKAETKSSEEVRVEGKRGANRN